MRQLRQPRLAEIIAASLRDDILTGKLTEGDSLPRQEDLFTEFRVSLPAVREAMRILETEGLVEVRRGNVGGAVVHLPTADRTAQMIAMVLQTRAATPGDVSGTLSRIEPVCAQLCAARQDRATEVIPALRDALAVQEAEFGDPARYSANARRFHETLVERCGSETMILVIGALETIWSAHESAVWDEAVASGDAPDGAATPDSEAAPGPAGDSGADRTSGATPGTSAAPGTSAVPGSSATPGTSAAPGTSADGADGPADPPDGEAPMAERARRAALRDHHRLLAAIEAGDEARAAAVAAAHLAATRHSTLASSTPGAHATINANLVGGIDLARRR